jgi:hypothetical protein
MVAVPLALVAVNVTEETAFARATVYMVVPCANAVLNAPEETLNADNLHAVEGARFRLT